MTSRTAIVVGVLLTASLGLAGGCGTSKRQTDAAEAGNGCLRWGITSETGNGWTVGKDMSLDVYPTPAPGSTEPATVRLSSKAPPFGAAEGRIAHCLEVQENPGGMAFRLAAPQDMSRFAGGRLVFQLAADNIDRLVAGMRWGLADQKQGKALALAGRATGVSNVKWAEVAIPLADFGANLAVLTHPFEISAEIGLGETRWLCVDDVHFEAACGGPVGNDHLDAGDAALFPDSAKPGLAEAGRDGRACLSAWVPGECVPPGADVDSLVYGILLECKRDLRIDDPGEAKVGWWGSGDAAGTILSPASRPTDPVEGTAMLCATVEQGSGSTFLYYDSPRDFSDFEGGYLETELFGDGDVLIGLSWRSPGSTSESRSTVPARKYVVASANNGWRSIRVPLCAFRADLTSLLAVASFSAEAGSGATTFCADAIRFRKPTASCSERCSENPPDGSIGPPETRDAGTAAGPETGDSPAGGPDLLGCYGAKAVPAECISPGENAGELIHGILLECKQDVRIDEAGQAKVGFWLGSSSTGAMLSSADPKPTSPVEGSDMLCATVSQGSGGAFVYYDTPRDYSRYQNGFLEAELFGPADADVLVGLSWKSPGATSESHTTVRAAAFVVASLSSGWRSIRIPLCRFGADLTSLVSVAAFSLEGRQISATFCVDAVRFRQPTSTCRDACVPDAGADSAGGPDAGAPADADAAGKGDASVRADGTDAPAVGPDAGCYGTAAVPAACIPSGKTAAQLTYGILLECKQDVRIDEAGEAKIGLWLGNSSSGSILSPTDLKPTSPVEGSDLLCATVNQGSGSVFVYYESPRDYAAFQNGYLELELFGDADVLVGLSWKSPGASAESRATVRAADHVVASAATGWKSIRVPLCLFRADLTSLLSVASFSVEGRQSPTTFCVDAIRFREATSFCADSCPATAPENADAAASDLADTVPAANSDAGDAVGSTLDSASLWSALVPNECIPAGETAGQQVAGILLECKQDVVLDQPSQAHVGWWQSGSGVGGILGPEATKPTLPFEGSDLVCATVTGGTGSFFVYYDGPRDFSAFANGFLEAELFTYTDQVHVGLTWVDPEVGIGSGEHQGDVVAIQYAVSPATSGWIGLRIPLCVFGADLGNLKVLASFSLTNYYSSPETFCVDAVRFRKATPSCAGCCSGC